MMRGMGDTGEAITVFDNQSFPALTNAAVIQNVYNRWQK